MEDPQSSEAMAVNARVTSVERLSAAELLREIGSKTTALARAEVQLAKAEMRSDLRREVGAAIGLGLAVVSGLIALSLSLVAVAFALGRSLDRPTERTALWIAG